MHKGRIYPYAPRPWQCEVFFWPGYVPEVYFVRSSGMNGDLWDLLSGGVVCYIDDWDAPAVGDIRYSAATLPPGLTTLRLALHKVGLSPKRYSLTARVSHAAHANLASVEIGPSVTTATWPAFTFDSGADPPYFNGHVPDVLVRPARWGEF